jgi:hypothetical protein
MNFLVRRVHALESACGLRSSQLFGPSPGHEPALPGTLDNPAAMPTSTPAHAPHQAVTTVN